MRIAEKVSLFYPDADKQKYAADRRTALNAYPQDYLEDLEAKRVALMILPQNPDKVITIIREMNDDLDTLSYRLDCIEDFMRQPLLSDTFRAIIRRLSDNNSQFRTGGSMSNSFMEIRMRIDGLQEFLDCIDEINAFYLKCKKTIKSQAMINLFSFFENLTKTEDYLTVKSNLEELQKIFSKSIKSVTIGINFTADMTPELCGIMEVSNKKIYPKQNVLDKILLKPHVNVDYFPGDVHTNSAVKKQPADMDTALFRELSEYTKEYSRKIASALKGYRELFFTDIGELEHQLDFYDGAVKLINHVRGRGLQMCRPNLLRKDERKMKLKNAFDLCFFRQAASADYSKRGDELIICNDISMDDERFYMITGVNNGGKTTFARGTGICQMLAQLGMYVPAEEAEISVTDYIFTHFPKEEEVSIDSSRFTTEIKQLSEICRLITPHSMVIMNESIQSTTPKECLDIAGRHLEILAAAGVRGMYVTHLNDLYANITKINKKKYPTKIGSLVSVADKKTGKRLYKIENKPPMNESMAYTVYDSFGAKLDDVLKRLEGGSK